MKKSRKIYYVSLYKNYPIYEPAEGGYYYEGRELYEYKKTYSLKKARRVLRKMATEYELCCGRNMAWTDGKYIGDGYTAKIETKLGNYESGYVPFC